jgi:hypothetical protein
MVREEWFGTLIMINMEVCIPFSLSFFFFSGPLYTLMRFD